MVEANTQEYAFNFLEQSLKNRIQDAEVNCVTPQLLKLGGMTAALSCVKTSSPPVVSLPFWCIQVLRHERCLSDSKTHALSEEAEL